MSLAALSWPQVPAGALLAVPVGSTEQHGPHLPFTVDTEIAVFLADALAAARADVVVAPALAYGSSGEHGGFPGTLSIGQRGTELVLVELVRSADAFAGVVLVCAHGGNAEPLARAVTTLRSEGRSVLAWSPRWPDDLHAGLDETSVMLAIRPGCVDTTCLQAGDRRTLDELLPLLQSSGVAGVAPNGVLGDPSAASAELGRALLDTATADLVARVSGWRS
jgi:mycofactocin system creatininase family protein